MWGAIYDVTWFMRKNVARNVRKKLCFVNAGGRDAWTIPVFIPF